MKKIGYIAAQRIKSLKGQHIDWRTEDDDKNIKLNCRDYTAVDGERTAVQIKPRISVGGTTAIVGLENSPGINDGISGSYVIGYKADCYMKGDSGTLSYIVAAFDGSITDQNVGGRIFNDDLVVGSRLWHQLHGGHTFNGHIVGFLTRNAGGGKAWDALLKFEGDQVGAWMKTLEATTAAGYIKVLFGATERWIQLYSTAPA